MTRPLLLVHGYAASSAALEPWRDALLRHGAHQLTARDIRIAGYRTLTNEVSIDDLAEGFDRALRIDAGLSRDEPFDAIVHSTGMLVLRAWLAAKPARRSRLKHLIALAPATFGSPLAHKGRSWLGALLKGNRTPGPDFMEAGDRVLDALELGSSFTWQLAHRDLLADEPVFGSTSATPWVFIFCGTRGYGGVARLLHPSGSDGCVRIAGAALNVRKFELDLSARGVASGIRARQRNRIRVARWRNVDVPVIPLAGYDHHSIIARPDGGLVSLVHRALQVRTRADYDRWYRAAGRGRLKDGGRWQQFIVHAQDERGAGISDFNLQLFTRVAGRERVLRSFESSVHVYRGDPSYRSFHVDLDTIEHARLSSLWLRVLATSGTSLVGYHGHLDRFPGSDARASRSGDTWQAQIDLSTHLRDSSVRLFHPLTTTLIQLTLDREPLPLEGDNRVFWLQGGEASEGD